MPKYTGKDVYRMDKAVFLTLWVEELQNPSPTIKSLAEACVKAFAEANAEYISKYGQPDEESMQKRTYGKCRSLVLAMRRDIGKELPIPKNSKKPTKSLAQLLDEVGGTSYLK
tara:strand:+ start:1023 stop:1361 length:339 start_codon:yes stop_codon:yes gene_type:complete